MNVKTNLFLFFSVSFFLPFLCSIQSVSTQSLPLIQNPSRTVTTIYSHGIIDTYKQAFPYAKSYKKNDVFYTNERYLIHTPYVSFNYPDATNKFYKVNWSETSFGQENEIDRLRLVYQRTINKYQDCDIVLFGLSRGASNVAIFAGLHQYDNIKALVLESPYNTMTDVIENVMHQKCLGWLDVSYGETMAEFIFKKYKRNGWSPKNCCENIPKDIPILIICSKEDQLVPCSSSINLYKNLISSGHEHTYILITDYGKHAHILHGPDSEKYHTTVNAFYKKYNLPYCPTSAAKGESYLTLCQPIL
jgi:hypothetical protein